MVRLGEKISILRAERGLSVKGLASEAQIDASTLLRVEHERGRFYPDTVRKIVSALHQAAPLSEQDAVDIADATKLSRGAVLELLRRLRPLVPAGGPPPPPDPLPVVIPIEAWRHRLHALVDRMLARAERPQDVETALVAMVAAFEAAMPDAPEGPMLTKRGEPRQTAPGVIEQVDEHFVRKASRQ